MPLLEVNSDTKRGKEVAGKKFSKNMEISLEIKLQKKGKMY
jgi:hypothetical protein